jgi:E3 ubiquitin-protein ligase RNF115/126
MSQPQRDIVFCHQCENEWYRDEGGLTCPDCQSDFTEIVEGTNDPRAQEVDREEGIHAQPGSNNPANHPLHTHDPWNAPDPDEDDIDHFQWQTGPRYHATYNRTIDLNGRGQVQGQAPGAGGGLLGMIGNMVGGLLQQQPQPQRHEQGHEHTQGQGQGNEGLNRSVSAPGSPTTGEQQPEPRPGVYTRHVHGPGYTFTMTATSGNLSPRNANTAQPYNPQPQDMDDLMQQMFNNIGGFPPLGMPGQDPRQNEQPRNPNGNPVFPATLFQLLNNLAPPGGVHGDAVYSQEALDRIVSQLMEQHQTGNAPGPATETAIRSLPSRPITEADAGDSGSADCSICMDTVPLGDSVTTLPCSHWFHHECIRAWLGEHDTCPVCRKGIMPAASDGEGARTSTQAPLHDRSAAAAAAATPTSGGNSSAGMFSRMRDAFGGGNGGGGGGAGAGGGGRDSST